MPFSVSGHPLHTRTLSVTLQHAAPPRVACAAYVLDLRKRGFAPVGGDLQGTGIIHHMRLDGVIDRAAGRIARSTPRCRTSPSRPPPRPPARAVAT